MRFTWLIGRPGRLFAFATVLCACSSSAPPSGGDEGSTSSSSGSSLESSSGKVSSSSSASSGGASGTTGTTDNTTKVPGGGGDPIASCITACEAKYAKGVPLGNAIDTCWSAKCPKECIGIGTGTTKPAANGDCKNPVSTPSAACSQCTVDSCCKAWDGCFGDATCSGLNACSIACYK